MKRIVVVDDAYIMHHMLRNMLKDEYEVLCFADGSALTYNYEELKADFVILDIRLEKGSGYDVLKSIREIDKDIPVMVYSALGQSQDIDMAMECGATCYIQKPAPASEILEKVKEYI